MAVSESQAETAEETEPVAAAYEPELVVHPAPRQYVWIAVWLAIATAFEVGLYYLNMPRAVLVPLLLGLAIIKFALVVLFFMHLKFDSPLFRQLFVTGIVLAMSVYLVVLVAFRAFGPWWLLAPIATVIVLTGLWIIRSVRRGGRPEPTVVARDAVARTGSGDASRRAVASRAQDESASGTP